jgi:hypothetical protein
VSEEIDAAKVEAMVAVLKDALPELVAVAFAKSKVELPRILPGLTDDEWTELKRTEDQRRKGKREIPTCSLALVRRLNDADLAASQ